MKRFRITEDNAVEAHEEGTLEPGPSFDSLEELEQLAADWPLRRFVEVWNNLPDVQPVSRFENRKVAARRIWRALSETESTATVPKRRRIRKSKTEVVLAMLRSPEGATLKALQKATKWQSHSVRGFLSGKVSKALGLPLASFKRDGERVYAIREPEQA